jgi:hypothetical protein
MTKQQISRLQVLTSKLASIEGMSFSVLPAGATFVLSASNAEGMQWFQTNHSLTAFIGPRGGVRVYHAQNISI